MTGNGIELVGYSERGLVNALVDHLRGDADRVRAFLGCVEWPDEAVRARVADIAARGRSFGLIVEASFAQFGDPDLILTVDHSEREQGAVFFVEAKIVPYEQSARRTTGACMKEPGWNSTINGQLALRYRLARALAASGAARPVPGKVEEPEGVWKAYGKDLGDAIGHPRRLEKSANLAHLVPKLVATAAAPPQAVASFLERTFYVALTHDTARPAALDEPGTPPPWAPAYLPDDATVPADPAAPWALAARHTGWSGWTRLEEGLPGLVHEPFYEKTRPLALALPPARAGVVPPLTANAELERLRTRAWGVFDALVQASAAVLGRALAEELAGVLDDVSYVERTGSGSLLWRGRTIGKIVPRGDAEVAHLLVGLAADQSVPLPEGFQEDVREVNGRRFGFRPVALADVKRAAEELRPLVGPYADDLRHLAQR